MIECVNRVKSFKKFEVRIMLNYLTIDFLIIIFPLIFSFKWKFKYYKFFKPLFASIAIVGTGYIIWDAIVTYRGDWYFDHKYVMDFEILGLPIEEILFFITVPFACIFIYENLVYFVKDKELPYNRYFYFVLGILFVIFGVIFYKQDYTILSLFSVAFFFFMVAGPFKYVVKSRLYWFYLVLSFIPFIIFNYLLTSVTIVHYNSKAIWGIRVTTIPLEDFFYNFSMLSFYLLVYLYFKRKWINSKKGK